MDRDDIVFNRRYHDQLLDVIDDAFVPAAKIHFAECVDDARAQLPAIRKRYREVRDCHRQLYVATLQKIREQDNSFDQLLKQSVDLVHDAALLKRPVLQKARTLSGVIVDAEAARGRFASFVKSIESTTGASFHEAPRKGLLRMVEEMLLTQGTDAEAAASEIPSRNSTPRTVPAQRICDVNRGAVECRDFKKMLAVMNFFHDQDAGLSLRFPRAARKQSKKKSLPRITLQDSSSSKNAEKICICKAQARFGEPTCAGWADIVIHFYFKYNEAS